MKSRMAIVATAIFAFAKPAHATTAAGLRCEALFSAHAAETLVLENAAQLRVDSEAALAHGNPVLARTLYEWFQKSFADARRTGLDVSRFPVILERQRAADRHRRAEIEERREQLATKEARLGRIGFRQGLPGHAEGLVSVAYSPDGLRLATTGAPDAIVWDTRTWQPFFKLASPRPNDQFNEIRFSGDGQRIIATSKVDEHSFVYEADGRLVGEFATSGDFNVGSENMGGFLNHDGSRVYGLTQTRDATVFDTATGAVLFQSPPGAGALRWIKMSSDEKTLVAANKRDVFAWDIASKRKLYQISPDDLHVGVIALSPDGSRLVIGYQLSSPVVLDAKTGVEIAQIPLERSWPTQIIFSPNGKLGVIVELNKDHVVFDVQSGRELYRLKNETMVKAQFTPTGDRLIFASTEGTVDVWDVDTHAFVERVDLRDGLKSFAHLPDFGGYVNISMQPGSLAPATIEFALGFKGPEGDNLSIWGSK